MMRKIKLGEARTAARTVTAPATHLVDQGKQADVIFLDFSKAFGTVSHNILLDKMSSIQLDKCII